MISRSVIVYYICLCALGQEHAGGRVHSVPIDGSARNYVELGAQWVHGENNPIYELANQDQLLSNITSEEGLGK